MVEQLFCQDMTNSLKNLEAKGQVRKLLCSFTNELMRKSVAFIALVFLDTSCGMLKSGKKMKPRDGVVFYAKEYMGAPYRVGGNNRS